VSVGVQICEALGHVHSKQIIHRDIKPDNFVWYGADVRMIDFGIAKLFGEDVSARPLDQFTQHLEFVGPVFFSSPELIAYAGNKKHPVDQRSDLFQLGKVLWFLATGTISAGIPSRRECPLNGGLHDIVFGLLNDDPDDRPGDAMTVRDQLSKVAV
jgi:serine/threonine-protein kinase